MRRYLPLLLISFLLMGQEDCEVPPVNTYCAGAPEGTFVDGLYEFSGRQVGELNTIIGGELSIDRRSTAQVFFGRSYCTGIILGPHTVLIAAHCGYGATTTHTISVDNQSYTSNSHLVHPDYWGWVNDNNFEGRKSDIMILYTEGNLPGPYPLGAYSSTMSNICTGLTAQGYGQDEFPDEGPVLRESNYIVTSELEKSIKTKQATWGGICFGDSGGPLYAQVSGQPGLHVAGVTSTTNNRDCLQGSTHVKVAYFWPWVIANFNSPGNAKSN